MRRTRRHQRLPWPTTKNRQNIFNPKFKHILSPTTQNITCYEVNTQPHPPHVCMYPTPPILSVCCSLQALVSGQSAAKFTASNLFQPFSELSLISTNLCFPHPTVSMHHFITWVHLHEPHHPLHVPSVSYTTATSTLFPQLCLQLLDLPLLQRWSRFRAVAAAALRLIGAFARICQINMLYRGYVNNGIMLYQRHIHCT